MNHDLDRRHFIAWFSSMGAAALLAPEVLAQSKEAITLAAIAKAEAITGLPFTEDERKLMETGVKDHLGNFEKIREIPLANSIPPALTFSPLLPGRRVTGENVPIRPTQVAAPAMPTDGEDLAFLPLTHLGALLRERRITSFDLTRFYLGRLKRFDPQLHCVITLTEERALEQARRADDELRRGIVRGPLHGIPYGVKDLFATRGIPTTWGSNPYKDQVPTEDSTVVKRLEEAGAVLVAKTSVGELAWGDVWFGGTTRNPWNLEQGSSGSSAGSAASVAAGLVGFAIGTETLGSIVSPSTRCGATGLRPTFGRVSRHGAMALSWSMDKVGPICRSVEDCALVLDAIRGADDKDGAVIDAPFNWDSQRDPRTLRVGYDVKAFEEESPDHALDEGVLQALRQMGFALKPVELPPLPVGDMLFILEAEAAAAFDDLTRSGRDETMTRQEEQAWPNVFRAARFIPAVEYIQANRARTVLMESYEKVFDAVDVYVHPSFGGNTLLIANLTGQPTVVVRSGFREDGTPASISFTGRLFGEADALLAARAYQDATGFHLRRPPLA
jgi:Asp-tRNA(Asn)/Glu-tRNA(Gln) amidotransferase A subunit family amidase